MRSPTCFRTRAKVWHPNEALEYSALMQFTSLNPFAPAEEPRYG